MTTRMKPFFPYFGSKYRMAKAYPDPIYDVVIEPFAGSACYSLWHGVGEAILIDADSTIVAVWDYLINATPDDIAALPDVTDLGDSVDDYDIPDGAKALIGFWLTKGSHPVRRRGAYAASEQWRRMFWRPQVKERIASQVNAIKGWHAIRADFMVPLLRKAPATYFIDPPYQVAGKHYVVKFHEYDRLRQWVQALDAEQIIVCEGAGADWLPFSDLGDFKTFKTGSSHERVWLGGVAA